MNDNLPEIDFKEKKEKKGGFIGWLRGRLGMGSRGGAMGEAGMNPAAMNLGRAALGGGKFGTSSGLAGLLAGKVGMIATIAAVAVAGGLYVARNASAPAVSTSAFNSGKTGKDYVPAILRSQAANQGSSLDMFKDTNKGTGLGMEADPNAAAKKEPEANSAPADEAAVQEAGQAAPGDGGMGGSLTSSLGGGSSKFSAMGGFGNKFGQGDTGAKVGFTSGIGAGFGGMPKFDARKNKMLAMKSSARPVFGGAKAGSAAKGASKWKSMKQAKGLRNTQKSYTGKDVDSMRSTQDKAWEGATAEGDVSGGSGVGAGAGDGAGVVTSPSLDTGGGSGGGSAVDDDTVVPEASTSTDVSPWTGLVSKIMMLIIAAAVLAAVASKLCASATPWVYWLGVALAVIAAAMSVVAIVMAVTLISSHGQSLLGGLYVIGGGLALAASIAAFAGGSEAVLAPGAVVAMWLAAGAGVIALMGSMLGGK